MNKKLGCYYLASGQLSCPNDSPPTLGPNINIEKFDQPAWVNKRAEELAYADNLSKGFPVSASEWQIKGNEKHGKVDNINMNLSSPTCLYSAEGKIVCI